MERESKHLRVMSKGVWRSICRDCLQTIAIAVDHEAELDADETVHTCTGVYKLPDTVDIENLAS